MESYKICSFFGHRDIEITKELRTKLYSVIENLITNHEVSTFLFGSRSVFNNLCHKVVDELKEIYKDIKRISYSCRNETCILESERQKWENIYSNLKKTKVDIVCFDEEVHHKTKYTSGKAIYVERNQFMIDDSDFCVFYYDENYLPKMRRHSKSDIVGYQPKSGTKLAYEYAKKKKKHIINLYVGE